jgi:pimeloyl-ACP methyl ester carboxylesterase
MSKSTQTKPSIVFCHGIWADGSSFSKVIPPLQADGYEVMAAQYGLDTPEGDVATVKRTLGRVSSPALLVGHSYGGSVITAAGTDERVVGLVYIAALAPDAGETSQSQQEKFPVTDVFKYVEVADGRVWMRPEGVACFAGDLPEQELPGAPPRLVQDFVRAGRQIRFVGLYQAIYCFERIRHITVSRLRKRTDADYFAASCRSTNGRIPPLR